jgi:hypothetical protein
MAYEARPLREADRARHPARHPRPTETATQSQRRTQAAFERAFAPHKAFAATRVTVRAGLVSVRGVPLASLGAFVRVLAGVGRRRPGTLNPRGSSAGCGAWTPCSLPQTHAERRRAPQAVLTPPARRAP